MAEIPPPPEGRFGKWAYQLWDYVAKNRLGAAAAINPGTGLLVGTGTGTFTVSLRTTGVGAGTYGTGATWPQFSVDAVGRLITATAGGTIGPLATNASLVAAGFVIGTTTTGTLTTAYGGTGTLAVGGLLSTRGVSAAIGSSTTQAPVVVTPYVDGNSVSLTTAVGTLMRYGVPASAMSGSGQGFSWLMWGTAQAALGIAGRFSLVFGTATIAVATSLQAPLSWQAEGNIFALSTSQQVYQSRFNIFNAGASELQIDFGTLGMNLSTVTTLGIIGTTTTANTTRVQLGMAVNFFGRQ